jgi:hypothetical protein
MPHGPFATGDFPVGTSVTAAAEGPAAATP